MPTDKKLKSYAKHLRHNQTAAERGLWVLRLFTYRAQRPIYGYVPDFYSPLFHVAIEVNGSVHDTKAVKQRDKTKRKHLMERGIYTLYVSNNYARIPLIVLAEALATGGLWLLIYLIHWTWQRVRV